MPTSFEPTDAARSVRENQLVLVDVRDEDEWIQGHVPGARHIPLDDLGPQLDDLPRDAPIAFICRTGKRSGDAADQARAGGLDAGNVAGGMDAWREAGLPVEGDAA